MKVVLVALAFAVLLSMPVASAHCFNEYQCAPDPDPLFNTVCNAAIVPLNAAAETADRVVCHL